MPWGRGVHGGAGWNGWRPHLVGLGGGELGGDVLAGEGRAVAAVVALHDVREDRRAAGLEAALDLGDESLVVHRMAERFLAPHHVELVSPLLGQGLCSTKDGDDMGVAAQ